MLHRWTSYAGVVLLSCAASLAIGGQPVPATSGGPAGLAAVQALISRDDVVELTRSLVRIRSDYSEGTLANHREIAAFLAQELERIGMDVRTFAPDPDYPMVVGRLKGRTGRPVLGTMGHYNTVPVGDRSRWTVDPFGAEVRDGRIYGLGASDQKAGIAALIVATRAIVASGVTLDGDLIHVYIPGEGAQEHVLPIVVDNHRAVVKADWYLDTDGGRDIIGVAAGHIWLQLTVKGKSAHPGGDTPWVNAGYKLAKVLVAMEQVDEWMTYEKHPLFPGLGGKPRVEVGTISAGHAVNQIPDRADARVDIRLNPRQTVDGVMAELHVLLARLKKQDPEIDVAVKMLPGTQHVPYHHWASLTPDEPLISVIRQVAGKHLGREPGFVGSRGGGRPDLWRMGTKWISWGAGKGSNAHAPDEWADIEGTHKSAEIYAEIILRVLGLSPPGSR
jgi:succinyl-diaminopimelate desuccinylase